MKDHMMKHHGIRLEDNKIQVQQQDKNYSQATVLSPSKRLNEHSDLNTSLNKEGDAVKL